MQRLSTIIVGAFLASGVGLFAGCASSGSTQKGLWADGEREPVLLSASGAFEIHVRGGKVIEVVPATEPGGNAKTRVIGSMDELRTLYEESSGKPMPAEATPGVVQINGWRGLECLRAGRACGPSPEVAPQAMVILRFR
ncbi:MAG: hypothetical protein U1F43_01195 [Myxococcota bacterium]